MSTENVIGETKKLLNDQRFEEAKEYIKRHAYYYAFNRDLDSIYITLFKPSSELIKELGSTLKKLQSNDIAIRKKAADYINKVSRGNWTATNKDWLTDTRTISILIDAIEQETDEKILLDLVNTIGNISQRYEYYDLRILNILIPLYDNSSINIQIEACTKSIQFNDARTWNAICNIFGKKTTKNINLSLGLYITRYANNIPKEFIDKLSNLIENAFLKEKNLDAKDNLLLSLGKVGNKETIGFIKEQVIKKETDSLLIERANQAVIDITERLK